MNRTQKQEAVTQMNQTFAESETVVVTHYSGLTVAQLTELRAKLREQGASFKVTKNRLAQRALEGTQFEGLKDLFTGPTGVASSQDPVAAAKAVYEFAKDNEKLVILGGAMGAEVLDQAGVEQLAKMPSLDELRGKIVGMLVTPATRMATVLQAPASQLARVNAARAEKG